MKGGGIPKVQIRAPVAQHLQASLAREAPDVLPVALEIAPIGEVQDQKIAAGAQHAGDLAKVGRDEIRPTRYT